jgi:fructokinase
MMARADIVKLSDEDLRWLSPDLPEAEAVAALLGLGPALVLITRGAEGATAWTAQGPRSMPARAVAVVDTVGAGDTFNAGILAALAAAGLLDRAALRVLDALQIDAALALATRASAITASRAGANPPWLYDLDAPTDPHR